jgi:hypothetical protein
MNRLLLIIAIALASTHDLVAEGQWPPTSITTVKAFSFSGGPSDLIIEDGKLHDSVVKRTGTTLSKEQSQKAIASLINGPNHFGFKYWCFEPRDALVFYDKDENMLLAVNICFTCFDWRPQLGKFPLRPDFSAMADLFAELRLSGGYDFSNHKADAYKALHRKKVEDWRERAEARDRGKIAGTPAEQAGTEQPATRPESKSEGSDKPQPEAEGRSR